MSLTADEIQALLDKQGLTARVADNPFRKLIADAIPAFFAGQSDWLPKPASASSICELQSLLLLRCRDDGSMLAMFTAGDGPVGQHMRQMASLSPFLVEALQRRADIRVRELFESTTLPELDQKVAEYRTLAPREECLLFLEHMAPRCILQWIMRGELTFQQVLEHAPHLLVCSWI